MDSLANCCASSIDLNDDMHADRFSWYPLLGHSLWNARLSLAPREPLPNADAMNGIARQAGTGLLIVNRWNSKLMMKARSEASKVEGDELNNQQ